MSAPDGRAAEVAAALAAVRARVDAACAAAGRDPSEVALLPVTKTFPASDVVHLVDLGVSEVGEARDQEGRPKAAEVAELRPGAAPSWQVLGRLQRNKARSVVRWATSVSSVDSPRLAAALEKAAAAALDAGERSAPLQVLVQASLDSDPDRGGCPVPDLPALADQVAGAAHLELVGLMAVAPVGVDPDAAFADLARVHADLLAAHPGAVTLSAGMSGDLEQAVAHGSTCVRVGTALLGGRPIASP
ncbi:YggS family pyridoxal phosphate-dependent enzyme [Rhodococcus aerolatus]